MLISVKTQISYDDLTSIMNNIETYISNIEQYAIEIQELIQNTFSTVDDLNSKLTPDKIDLLNDLGNLSDFELGFYDGLNDST